VKPPFPERLAAYACPSDTCLLIVRCFERKQLSDDDIRTILHHELAQTFLNESRVPDGAKRILQAREVVDNLACGFAHDVGACFGGVTTIASYDSSMMQLAWRALLRRRLHGIAGTFRRFAEALGSDFERVGLRRDGKLRSLGRGLERFQQRLVARTFERFEQTLSSILACLQKGSDDVL
jgi:hypothetical protein